MLENVLHIDRWSPDGWEKPKHKHGWGCFQLDIYRHGGWFVAVVTELKDNSGPSVTNSWPELRFAIERLLEHHFGDHVEDTSYVETYNEGSYRTSQPGWRDHFDEVEISSTNVKWKFMGFSLEEALKNLELAREAKATESDYIKARRLAKEMCE